jgi:hypothetical protein
MGVLLLGWEGGASRARAQSGPQLSMLSPSTNGWPRLLLAGATNVAWNLEASGDLQRWNTIATLHALDFVPFWTNPIVLNFHDAAAPNFPQRFYRSSFVPLTFGEDWKNQIYFPVDPFASSAQPNQGQWIKFAILTNEPVRIYYQDSRKYPFHYDFATARLEPIKGISRPDFDRVALHTNAQKVVLGAVLLPPATNLAESSILEAKRPILDCCDERFRPTRLRRSLSRLIFGMRLWTRCYPAARRWEAR